MANSPNGKNKKDRKSICRVHRLQDELESKKFIIKERNIFDPDFKDYKGIDAAIEELSAFHEAKEIIEKAK